MQRERKFYSADECLSLLLEYMHHTNEKGHCFIISSHSIIEKYAQTSEDNRMIEILVHLVLLSMAEIGH